MTSSTPLPLKILHKCHTLLTFYLLTLLMVSFLITQLLLSPLLLLPSHSDYEIAESYLVLISVNFQKVLCYIMTGGHNRMYLYLDTAAAAVAPGEDGSGWRRRRQEPQESESSLSEETTTTGGKASSQTMRKRNTTNSSTSTASLQNTTHLQHYNQPEKLFQLAGSALVISNHLGTADWITLFSFFDHYLHSAGKIRFMLKRQHLGVPVIGTAAWLRKMIFLHKDYEKDKKTIMDALLQFEKMNRDCWILLYPEGTFVTPPTKSLLTKVQDYARKNELPVMEHVLTPRTKGVELCLHRAYRHMFKQVISVTVAYSKPYDVKLGETFAPSMLNFFEYRSVNPTNIHVHFQVYPMETMKCEDSKQIQDWTHQEFLKKEQLLKYFREHGRFPGEQHEKPLSFRDWSLFFLLWVIWIVAVYLLWKIPHWIGKLIIVLIFGVGFASAAFMMWYDYIHQTQMLQPNKKKDSSTSAASGVSGEKRGNVEGVVFEDEEDDTVESEEAAKRQGAPP